MTNEKIIELPGLNCGICGCRTCEELAIRIENDPQQIKRCIYLSSDHISNQDLQPVVTIQKNVLSPERLQKAAAQPVASACNVCASPQLAGMSVPWHDSLGREFDFYLEHFPEEPGPREIILPHNPLITRELDIQVGDILIGRPLGMSCGCPITHCGVTMDVDKRTGVIVWCVTGPLNPRQKGYKDLGYYIAEGYEGLIHEARCEIKIGMRYYFQPRMCMLQWRHSGLVNYLNRMPTGFQVRVEGLWIG
ncbi:MAG: Fe-S cluster protein [Chloroflexi bacterium]|nr:Fe-S cluster protein [Chloroflexota bacterium]